MQKGSGVIFDKALCSYEERFGIWLFVGGSFARVRKGREEEKRRKRRR